MGPRILIIADIEGSSGCFTRESAKFLGKGWPTACLEMSRDVRGVVNALFKAGASQIRVQDFHRTGHNIFPGFIPEPAKLVQGYQNGPALGMGNPVDFDQVMMLGMHAPSGAQGFLSHTLTSRVKEITVKGALISEAQLFSAALAHLGIPLSFFSGCPFACEHTAAVIPGVHCCSIDKSALGFDAVSWREKLARAAAHAMYRPIFSPYNPQGPHTAVVTMTGGPDAANHIAKKWGLPSKGADIFIRVQDFHALFRVLSHMLFLTPLFLRMLPLALPLYHLVGRAGLFWAQKKAIT